MDLTRHIVICECGTPEHQLLFIHDPEDDTLYTEVHLAQYLNFFKRLWVGLRYAFGYKCKYGNFDTVIMGKKERTDLSEYLAKCDQLSKK
jgi:hypothetical protein